MARITIPSRKPKPARTNRIQAVDLEPGDRFSMNGEDTKIRTINELCTQRMRPHVHVVTPLGVRCYSFRQFV